MTLMELMVSAGVFAFFLLGLVALEAAVSGREGKNGLRQDQTALVETALGKVFTELRAALLYDSTLVGSIPVLTYWRVHEDAQGLPLVRIDGGYDYEVDPTTMQLESGWITTGTPPNTHNLALIGANGTLAFNRPSDLPDVLEVRITMGAPPQLFEGKRTLLFRGQH